MSSVRSSALRLVLLAWIANDNDFLLDATFPDPADTTQTITIPNPNQFFVFSFTDADLGGSKYVPQKSRTPFSAL